MTKLRWFIIKKLLSFTKAKRRSSDSAHGWSQATVIPEEPVVSNLTRDGEKVPASSMTDVRQPLDNETTVQESSMEVGVAVGVSESVDTLEDLVDQMEIEISDHGDEGESEETVGEESHDESPRGDDQQEPDKMEETENSTEKIRSSTTVSTGGGVAGAASKVRTHHSSEGGFGGGRRRRHSSTRLDKAEFPPISLDNQLSDDETLELMELLQVHVMSR